MAIDPRIALMGQPMDIGKSFRLGMDAAKNREELLMAPLKREAQQLANDSVMEELKNAPIRNQILQGQLDAQNRAAAADAFEMSEARRKSGLRSIAQGSRHLIDLVENKKDFKGALDFLNQRRDDLIAQGIDDTEETDAAIEALGSGDADKILQMVNDAKFYVDAANDEGLLDDSGEMTAETKTFEALTEGFTPEEKAQARRVKARIEPPAGTSAQERIADDPSLTQRVAESQADIKRATAQATEEGKAKAADFVAAAKSKIASEVSKAKAEAKSRGETLSELSQAQAALPGLLGVVDNLKELAPLATHTLGGKIIDTAVKELGFGATKGATARAKFQAIIDNQVLPLLKPTFGAAFTVQEGEALRATLGDVDASPEEKMAQLDAFIEGKMRDIETKERQLGVEGVRQPNPEEEARQRRLQELRQKAGLYQWQRQRKN